MIPKEVNRIQNPIKIYKDANRGLRCFGSVFLEYLAPTRAIGIELIARAIKHIKLKNPKLNNGQSDS